MKIISWNINGVRAVMKKDFLQSLQQMNPDVLCLQETKAQDDQVVTALTEVEGYHLYTNSAQRKGYSGVAILSRHEPLRVFADIGIDEHDQEGRVLTAEYDDFYLVSVYTPNSGSELLRLDYRQRWDRDFLAFVKNLEQHKPVLVGGDLNVAHTDIDLARPKPNYNKSAGYTQKEIDGLDSLLAEGFIDTFRYIYPDKIQYSWWSYRAGARGKNVGWRIDYFLGSKDFIAERVKRVDILNDVFGSDHCPVVVEI